jgi:hypothetical protein
LRSLPPPTPDSSDSQTDESLRSVIVQPTPPPPQPPPPPTTRTTTTTTVAALDSAPAVWQNEFSAMSEASLSVAGSFSDGPPGPIRAELESHQSSLASGRGRYQWTKCLEAWAQMPSPGSVAAAGPKLRAVEEAGARADDGSLGPRGRARRGRADMETLPQPQKRQRLFRQSTLLPLLAPTPPTPPLLLPPPPPLGNLPGMTMTGFRGAGTRHVTTFVPSRVLTVTGDSCQNSCHW